MTGAPSSRRFFRRHVAWPAEHGAWAFFAIPLAIGICAGARWTVPTLYLVVAALAGFLLRTPITRWVRIAAGLAPRADLGPAVAWTLLYALVAAVHVVGLVVRGHGYVLWLAAPGVPVFLVYLVLVARRRERHRPRVEIAAAGALALAAPAAYWIGRGGQDPLGWALFALAWGHTTFAIVLANVRLAQRRPAPVTAERMAANPALRLALVELVLVVAGSIARLLPPWLPVPYVFQVVAAVHATLVPATSWMPRRIGLQLALVTSAFATMFLFAWHA